MLKWKLIKIIYFKKNHPPCEGRYCTQHTVICKITEQSYAGLFRGKVHSVKYGLPCRHSIPPDLGISPIKLMGLASKMYRTALFNQTGLKSHFSPM